MRLRLFIWLSLFLIATTVHAQREGGRGQRGSFSLANLSGANAEGIDSLLVIDSLRTVETVSFKLTPGIGEPYRVPVDTQILNSSNRSLVEANSIAVGYLANQGSPAQTRIFSERKEARDFIFADAYDYYITTPANARFYDTRIPYTNVLYTYGGSAQNKEDHLKGVLTTNFGRKVNIGGELDYIYSRGHYNSNGNKLLSYRLFGSYKEDKYELYAYLSNYNFVNYENGGLSDDNYLTNREEYELGKTGISESDFPVRMQNTWNRVRGKQYFISHRYNLGYYRTVQLDDEYDDEIFIPVSSIIHTMEYEDNRRHFTTGMDTLDVVYYNDYGNIYGNGISLHDRTSMYNLKNTVALSLREGFQDWVKFGLTAFLRLEKRRYKLPAKIPGFEYDGRYEVDNIPDNLDFKVDELYDEFSTYIGAEITKQRGSLLTFNARGELCIIGDDLGELRVDGDVQSMFSLLGKPATVKALGYIKNVTPAFYQRHNHSRYFWWDNSLKNVQHLSIGGEVHLASTGTTLSAGFESIQNYVYFGAKGTPEQHGDNLQVITARLKQDLHYRAFGWENEAVYQLSSDKEIIPLPQISAHSNIYVHFKLFKVLTMQLGTEVYYNTKYYAPYYEPATQQFQLQKNDESKVKVGNYPLMNAYLNFHLKQARFYLMGYNISSLFLEPNYFSLPHYPLNPMVLKMGISVNFNN